MNRSDTQIITRQWRDSHNAATLYTYYIFVHNLRCYLSLHIIVRIIHQGHSGMGLRTCLNLFDIYK